MSKFNKLNVINELYLHNNSNFIEKPFYNNYLDEKQKQNKSCCSQILIKEESDNNDVFTSAHFADVNNCPQNNNNLESLKLKIMEKDKIIFDHMKKEKDLNKIISNLNQQISSKNEQNDFLNNQIIQFKFNNNQLSQNMTNNTRNSENSLILKLNEEKNDLINEISRLKFIIQNHEDTIKRTFDELNEKNENINDLQKELNEKKNFINENEEFQSNLRKENKKIPSLKTKINDLEKIIRMYQEQINELQKNYEIIFNKNSQLQQTLKQKKEEISENNLKIGKNIQKNIFTKVEEDTKIKEPKIYERFIRLKNDSDTFIRIFLNEIGNLVNYIEMIKINYNNGNIFQISSFENLKFQNFEEIKLDESFLLKYEIMCSSINNIKEKIINLLNKGNNYWNKINKERIASISESKKIFNNEKAEFNKKINEANNEIKRYQNIVEKLNKDYEKIKNNYLELQQNYKDFSSKNDFLESNYTNFIKQIENKLIDFPYEVKKESNGGEILNPSQKIMIQLNSLINFCKELNNRLKEVDKINKDINTNKKEEIQKLYNRIKTLNNLIKEKELIINKYKINEYNLVKINQQLEKSLFNQENNFNNNRANEDGNLNYNQKNEIIPEFMCNNDTDREMKLKKILDNLNIKKKINTYCNNIQKDDFLNYNYST